MEIVLDRISGVWENESSTTETTNDRPLSLDEYTGKEEAKAVRKLVRNALAQDWTVSVNDGEEWTVKKSSNFDEIIAALATTGGDTLRFRDSEGNSMGSMWLIYQGGNNPGDEVVSDYSDNESMEFLYRRTFPA